jgi:hypothetical protein
MELAKGKYVFETYRLQELGVICAKMHVRFTRDLVKRIKEKFGDLVSIELDRYYDCDDGEIELIRILPPRKWAGVDCVELAKSVERAIRKAAIRKAVESGEAKEEYFITLRAEDVDFSEAEMLIRK